MKLKISVLFVLIFSFSQVYSQQFYVKLHSGYGIGTSTGNFTSYSEKQNTQNETSSTSKVSNFSFGEGININGAFGYFINSNVGCELELQYSISSDLGLKSDYNFTDYTQKSERTLSSKSFLIIPSFFISTDFSSVRPYLKIGPILAFPGITDNSKHDIVQNSPTGPQNFKIEQEYLYDGGIAIGINSVLGIAYSVSGNITLIFEVNNKNISYSPDKGELRIAKQNGVTYLEQLDKFQKEIEFVDQRSTGGEPDRNNPSQQLKTQYSFSSLAFSLGVSLEL